MFGLIGAALIGAGASIFSGNKAAKAQQKGADAQVAESRRQYDQTRADWAPYREVGNNALQKLAGMYGAGSGGVAGAYGGFETSPGYTFRRDEGLKAIERSAASRGLLKSGASVKAIGRYADGLASSEYENYANRLAALAGIGQNATAATSAAGDASSGRIGDAYMRAGDARASSYANTGAAINNGISNLASAYLYQQAGGFGGGIHNIGRAGAGGFGG